MAKNVIKGAALTCLAGAGARGLLYRRKFR